MWHAAAYRADTEEQVSGADKQPALQIATSAHATHRREIGPTDAAGGNRSSGSCKHQSGHDGVDISTAAVGVTQPPGSALADDCSTRPTVANSTSAHRTSRCRDVCSFAAGEARIAIVGLDRRHDRFGRPGARYRRDCFATYSAVVPRAGGRLHGPDDAQVEPREVDVVRRAIASSVGHRTAGSPRFRSRGRSRRLDRIRVLRPRRPAVVSATRRSRATAPGGPMTGRSSSAW